MVNEKKLKKNNRTTPVPELLKPLIETVRMWSLDEDLPEVEDSFINFKLETMDDIYSNDALDLRDLLQESLGFLPTDLLEYIWGKDSIPESTAHEEIEYLGTDVLTLTVQTERAAANYVKFQHLWNQFKFVTRSVEEILSNKNSLSKDQIESMFNGLPIEPRFKFKKDETVSISFDQFTQAINGVRITFIRECKWCHKVFWAGRNDQNCCSSNNSDGKPSLCKISYNVSKSKLGRKKTDRRLKLREIKKKYESKEVWAYDETLTYTDSKSNQSKSTQLNDTSLKIIDIKFKDSVESNILKIDAYKLSTKREGVIELKYNNKLDHNLDRIFRIK